MTKASSAQVQQPQHGDERTIRPLPRGRTKPVLERYCSIDGWQNVQGSLSMILGCAKCGRTWE